MRDPMRETEDHGEPSGIERAKATGSTTMKQCGWCTHGSGSHRYNYMISGSCRLLPDYHPLRHVFWDTKCVLENFSKSDFQAAIDSHKYSIEEAQGGIEHDRKCIKNLASMKKSAPYCPPDPHDREADHFRDGAKVAVWFNDKGKWFFGKAVSGYRSGDGCVSYILDGLPPLPNGGAPGSGICRPEVLLLSEYKFFEEYPAAYASWVKKVMAHSWNSDSVPSMPDKIGDSKSNGRGRCQKKKSTVAIPVK